MTLAAVFGGLLLLDFALWERAPEVDVEFPALGRDYSLRIELSDLVHDRVQRNLNGSMHFEIIAARPKLEIGSLLLSLQESATGSDWQYVTIPGSAQGEATVGGQEVARAEETIKKTVVPVTTVRDETWYPFDEYDLELNARGCVGQYDCSASGGQNLGVSKAVVSLGDPDYVISSDQSAWPLYLRIRRHTFLRLVSVGLLAIAIAFFCFLLWPPGAPSHTKHIKDLMAQALGFVGTLWAIRAILVPDSVKIFPTLVDYVVLTLFVGVFVTIVIRYLRLYEPQA